MGWLCIRKHPDVKTKGAQVDLTDLEDDGVVMFQKRYFLLKLCCFYKIKIAMYSRWYLILMPLIAFVIPTFIPMYFWNETFNNAWYIAAVGRYTWSLNVTWSINSFAHLVGMKPYDKNISPCDNPITAIFTVGEGWHNYHHVFPWDYKAAELGDYTYNWTSAFIDFFAKFGKLKLIKLFS